MPHEKIISGDLDGDGVEGHRKKITGGEFTRREKEEHDFGQVPEKNERKDTVKGRSRVGGSDDLFYTGFGADKPRQEELPKKKSVIGGDSDIFDTGFGSATRQKKEKVVHSSGSPERNRQPESRQTGKDSRRESSFSPADVDELFESPEPSVEREPEKEDVKKSRRLDKDPFYTGFGYTDQRGKGSPADGGLFPEGDTLPEMPERELVPDRSWRDEPAEEEPEAGPEPEDVQETLEEEEKPKRSSVLTRSDDDLFS